MKERVEGLGKELCGEVEETGEFVWKWKGGMEEEKGCVGRWKGHGKVKGCGRTEWKERWKGLHKCGRVKGEEGRRGAVWRGGG